MDVFEKFKKFIWPQTQEESLSTEDFNSIEIQAQINLLIRNNCSLENVKRFEKFPCELLEEEKRRKLKQLVIIIIIIILLILFLIQVSKKIMKFLLPWYDLSRAVGGYIVYATLDKLRKIFQSCS